MIANRVFWAGSIFTLLAVDSFCNAQWSTSETKPTLDALQQQIDLQATQIDELKKQLESKADSSNLPFGVVPRTGDNSCTPSDVQRVPITTELPVEASCDGEAEKPKTHHNINFMADYQNGFLIRPIDPDTHPFQLKVNGWAQFRHHAFDRDVTSWTDNAGVTRPVENRSAFDIERARLALAGYAVDERLTYFVHMDGDTDGAHTVDFFDYWWGWQLTESFQLQLGKRKVAASRQWILGARHTRFSDRPMANDFFRPDRTVGIWGVGTLGDHGHYELMVGNGFNTANLPNSATDNRFTYAATNYFDPWGDYGNPLVDFAGSTEPLVRLGHSFVYSPQGANSSASPIEESSFLRLSDGTRLTQTGALLPGVTVSEFDLFFYGLDMAYKWRGWSFNSELFMRWIENISANVTLPDDSLAQYGFYTEGGYFLVPKVLDVNFRYSQVAGNLGTSSEYAAGFNWYPLAKPQVKISFDVTALDGSPLQNTTSDILVGDDGTLFRSQFQTEF